MGARVALGRLRAEQVIGGTEGYSTVRAAGDDNWIEEETTISWAELDLAIRLASIQTSCQMAQANPKFSGASDWECSFFFLLSLHYLSARSPFCALESECYCACSWPG